MWTRSPAAVVVRRYLQLGHAQAVRRHWSMTRLVVRIRIWFVSSIDPGGSTCPRWVVAAASTSQVSRPLGMEYLVKYTRSGCAEQAANRKIESLRSQSHTLSVCHAGWLRPALTHEVPAISAILAN